MMRTRRRKGEGRGHRWGAYRWPPDSSDNDSFHTLLKPTLSSKPSSTVPPSTGASFADAPGSSVEKMDEKSRFTLSNVTRSASFFLSSNS